MSHVHFRKALSVARMVPKGHRASAVRGCRAPGVGWGLWLAPGMGKAKHGMGNIDAGTGAVGRATTAAGAVRHSWCS